jgi:hypothetical protein
MINMLYCIKSVFLDFQTFPFGKGFWALKVNQSLKRVQIFHKIGLCEYKQIQNFIVRTYVWVHKLNATENVSNF